MAAIEEFDKCNFCEHSNWKVRNCFLEKCHNHEYFEPVSFIKQKIIDVAKSNALSVSDVIALINLD